VEYEDFEKAIASGVLREYSDLRNMTGTWIMKKTRYKRSSLRAHVEEKAGTILQEEETEGRMSKSARKRLV
jgi:hypothetical protein